jgi:uncharacterized membrane protein
MSTISHETYPIPHYMPARTAQERLARARRLANEQPLVDAEINVGDVERKVSLASGAILTLLGLARRDLPGFLIATVGGGLLYRGATGHCHTYELLGIDSADPQDKKLAGHGFHVVHSTNINKSPEELYAYWRKLDNLPNIMSHLESVRVVDSRRSHWTASAPGIVGGSIEWDAEITEDSPNERIAWQSLPDADVASRGSVEFRRLPGKRGTAVRVEMEYLPPAGALGKWLAKLFGEAPEQLIREDLRTFKRVMEIGEAVTTEGQPHGKCMGAGFLRRN